MPFRSPLPISLDDAIAELKSSVMLEDQKHQVMLAEWIAEWSYYLKYEKTFDPNKLIAYKRGLIVHINLGYNVGAEYGGYHYGIVAEQNNAMSDRNVIVLPLTSTAIGTPVSSVHENDVLIDTDCIGNSSWSIVKISSIRSVSKIRITAPIYPKQRKLFIDEKYLDEIDKKIIAQLTK